MEQTTAKERVEIELKELEEKTAKLFSFLCSEKFVELKFAQKYLLRKQYKTMVNYCNILEARLSIWED